MGKIILILSLVVILAGCCSTPLPPALTQEERGFIENHKAIDAVVAVTEYKYPVYSRELYGTLKRTDIFTDVIYLRDAHDKKVAYIAEENRRIHGQASLWPLLTVISVGIIPTWAEEENGISFILKEMNDPSKIYYVEVSWTGTTILGWVGLFAALLPDRTFFNPERSRRYYDRIHFEVLKALPAAEKRKN